MKVKELVEKLGRLDPDSELIVYSEDEEITPAGYAYRILDIVDVVQCELRTSRVEDGIVTISFGSQPHSISRACIELTSDV